MDLAVILGSIAGSIALGGLIAFAIHYYIEKERSMILVKQYDFDDGQIRYNNVLQTSEEARLPNGFYPTRFNDGKQRFVPMGRLLTTNKLKLPTPDPIRNTRMVVFKGTRNKRSRKGRNDRKQSSPSF